jgi:hypothetical protein
MSSDLQEALLTAGGAAALVAKHIDPVLLEYQRRYAPLVRALPTVKWGSTVYYFNKRTTLPQGGFVTDGGARPVSSSNYAQENFQIRLLQSVGAVTGYAQAVTADLIADLRAREIEGAARGLYWDVETALLWGAGKPTEAGPYPQFDGLDIICSSFSSSNDGGPSSGIGGGGIDNYGGAQTWAAPNYNPWVDGVDQNAINASGNGLTLGQLDTLIDMVESNVAEPVDSNEWMFLMSPTANSRLAQLLVNQQRFVDKTEIEAGLIVPTYRGVPIIKSSFLNPRTQVMGTVTAGAGSGDMTGTYHYRVSAVMARFGEIQASVDAHATVAGDGIYLSFSTPVGPEGAQPTHYKVYRGTSSSNHTLLGIVDANFIDGSSNVWATTTITDTGSALIPTNGMSSPANTPSTYVYGNVDMKPLSAGSQSVYLMSRDPNYIVRPFVREMQPVNVYPTTASPDSLPFAFVADTTLAVRAPKYIGRLANVTAGLDFTSGNGVLPTDNSYSPTPAPSY